MSKDQFYQSISLRASKRSKRIEEYLKQQNADKEQLEHIKGNKQTWK